MKELNMDIEYIAKYTMKHTAGGYQFIFYCAYCDFHYTTGWIKAGSTDEAYALAENEARAAFNGCHGCGKWICQNHYNIHEGMCLECAPLNKNENNTVK
jgi:hypothetical protein